MEHQGRNGVFDAEGRWISGELREADPHLCIWLGEEVQQDPYGYYAAMRSDRPVMRIDGEAVGRPGDDVYCVARYEDVHAILLDHETYSSRFGSPGFLPDRELRRKLKEISDDERLESFSVIDESSLRYAPSFILRGLESLKLDVTYRLAGSR